MKGQYFPEEWAEEVKTVKAAPLTGDTVNSYVYQPLIKVRSTLAQYARSADPETQRKFNQAMSLLSQASDILSDAIIGLT